MAKRILLIDGNSLIYRAYFANSYRTQTILRTSTGIPTNAIYSFINMLLSLLGKENYDEVKVAFDAGKKTFRHQKMPGYKAKRQETPQELLAQLPLAREFLDKIGIQWFALDQFEADDIIGCLKQKVLQRYPHAQVDILTGDRDLYQLISPQTQVLVPRSGTSDLIVMNEAELKHLWHTTPEHVPDLKGLMGDSSDNLTGVAGIGEKTAVELIGKYQSLENIYRHLEDFKPGLKAKLIAGKEAAFFTREMATLDTQCPLKGVNWGNLELDLNALQPFLEQYEMKTILRRLGLIKNTEENLKHLKINVHAKRHQKIKLINGWQREWDAEENTIYVESLDANYHYGKIIGISVFNDHGLFYWDWNWSNKQLSLFETPPEMAIDASFDHFLQSLSIKKNTYDLKRTLTLLTNAGYHPNPQSFIYDMLLASYDLNPTIPPTFSNYAYLINPQEKILIDEEFFGTGINRTSQPKQKASFIAHKAVVIAQTKAKFLLKLKEHNLTKIYQNLDLPLATCLFHMEQNGVQVSRAVLENQLQEIKQQSESLNQRVRKILPTSYQSKEINLGSSQQVKHLLFDVLRLPDNFNGSTNHVALETIANSHPLVNLIIEYRNLEKWRSSLESFKRYISNDQRIHTLFQQTATTTGRLSSNEPNLQAVAIRDESQKTSRKIFVTERNWKFYSFDYSQIELRVLAEIAPEANLLKIFRAEQDPHSETARQLFKLRKNQKITAEQRRLAKVFNFGIIYGLTPYGLTQQISLPLDKAKELSEAYYAAYPGIKNYQTNQINFAKTHGHSLNITNRLRPIPELKASDYHIRQFGERIAINTPAQNTSADIVKMAMVNIDREFTKHHYQSQMLAQIHDELIFNIFDQEAKHVVPLIKQKMESAFSDVMQLVDPKIKVKVPLKVSIKSGPTWYELK